jgi:hypothetical protein
VLTTPHEGTPRRGSKRVDPKHQELVPDKITNEEARRSARGSRRDVIAQTINPELKNNTGKMLFDEDCGNYEFSTVEMWGKLEDTFFSELYNKAKKNVPGLLQKETEYILQKEKENTEALDKKGQTGKKKKEGKSFLGLNLSDAQEIYQGEPQARVESGQTLGIDSR